MIESNDFSKRYRFSEWPNTEIPLITAGLYVIWDDKQLVYCGMSEREIEKYKYSNSKKKYGLINRLNSHASGRLSGDQFCVYVANRIVIPSLEPELLEQFRDGTMNLDRLTKRYVHDRLEYQYALVENSAEAFAAENLCSNGTVFGVKPYLNPLN
jgi:hypothetical protein